MRVSNTQQHSCAAPAPYNMRPAQPKGAWYNLTGIGDAFTSYTINAIKKIGIFDERFANIGWCAEPLLKSFLVLSTRWLPPMVHDACRVCPQARVRLLVPGRAIRGRFDLLRAEDFL